MDLSRWCALMDSLSFEKNISTYEKLLQAYSESHRHYHNVEHIKACLIHFDQSNFSQPNLLAKNYSEIELALWFHDAVYSTFSSSNEKDSAEWAKEFLIANNASSLLLNNVDRLIMATLHDFSPSATDEMLLVDIDLSILGSDAKTYQTFEENIRREYRFVPSVLYRKKRKEILNNFLERKRIYSTDFFYKKLEKQAKQNLKNAISSL